MERLTLNSVNLNATVFVEITDFGWNAIREYYRNLFQINEVEAMLERLKRNTHTYVGGDPIKERKLTEMQLHEVANLMGSKMYVGMEACIEGNQIYLIPETHFVKQELEKE